jgi:RecB family exonuclease
MAHRTVHLPVLANEWAFHVPMQLEGNQTEWLTGRIDRVARDGDRVLVIDWKTGTGVPRNPETDWQTRLYLYALVEVAKTPSADDLGLNFKGPLQPEQMQFVYIEVKADPHTPIREVVLPYSVAKHEATRQVLQSILHQMNVEEEYALPENSNCPDRFCSYRTICGIDAPTGN